MGLSTLALSLIPLADALALNQARPLWLLVIAVLFLGESVGWRRPLGALIGLFAFDERPGWPLFAGAGLMMLSVAYIARREAQLASLRAAARRG